MTNCQPTPTSLAIEAQGIVKQFTRPGQSRTVTALSQVSLTVRTGSLTAIIGPDGAGKTTFMRLVCGLLKSDAGSLSVLGTDVASHPQAVQDRIGYMPQKFGLYEDLSVQENLDLYANLHAVPQAVRQDRFQKLLDLTGLNPFMQRMAGKLSGGMKQKLGLACTLVSMPPMLLLDEPTVGVDPLSRRELWQILDTLSASGSLTVLVATAYLEEAEHCHDVYILHKGHILAQGAHALPLCPGPLLCRQAAGKRPAAAHTGCPHRQNGSRSRCRSRRRCRPFQPDAESQPGGPLPVRTACNGRPGQTGRQFHGPPASAGTAPSLSLQPP